MSVREAGARRPYEAFVAVHPRFGSSQRWAAEPPGRSRLSSAEALAAPADAHAMASPSQEAQSTADTKRITPECPR